MGQNDTVPTKERILTVAIDLFSAKGYKEVTMREIAGAVGIKASSLYKHYECKEDILKSIFDLFMSKLAETEYPERELKQYVLSVSPETYLSESFALFRAVMWNDTVIKIARIITLEQRRDKTIREFFTQQFVQKPTQALQLALDIMIENGSIAPANTRVLAEEYSAYILYLYFEQNFLQDTPNLELIEAKMKQHNDFFALTVLKGKEK